MAVPALGGEPGARSARYAGPGADAAANNRLLLERLAGFPPEARRAVFVCVLALALPGGEARIFRGETAGVILEAPRGGGGFGYDPLFLSDDLGLTFAEAEPEAKNRVSHRARALRQLAACLDGMASAAAPEPVAPPPESPDTGRPANNGKGAAKSEFQRRRGRLIAGRVEWRRDDDGKPASWTIDGKPIAFSPSALGKIAETVLRGIVMEGARAFTKEDVECALADAGLKKSGAKRVIEILDEAIVKAHGDPAPGGSDKPKAFIYDSSDSLPGKHQYVARLTFE